MIHLIEKLRITCDGCKDSVIIEVESAFRKTSESPLQAPTPEGWKYVSKQNVFGTGYYDHCMESRLLCDKCQIERTTK